MISRGFLILRHPVIWAIGIPIFILFPHIVSNYVISIFVLIGIYGIAATALNLLLGNTGQVSLGQAAFYGIGAYTSALLTCRTGLSFWFAVPLSGILSGIAGYGVGLTSVRLRHSYLAMATIAFNEIFIVLVEEWEGITGGVAGFTGIMRPKFLGTVATDEMYFYIVWTILGLVLLFNKNLLASRVGSAIAAIRQDETASEALGIDVSRYKLKIFALSAFYTGVAGSLFAHYSRFIGPGSFHLHFSIVLLIMVELGGSRHPLGGVCGAAVVVLLPELLSLISKMGFFTESAKLVLSEYSYHMIVYGLLLFIIATFAPGGLIGWLSRAISSTRYLCSRRRPYSFPAGSLSE